MPFASIEKRKASQRKYVTAKRAKERWLSTLKGILQSIVEEANLRSWRGLVRNAHEQYYYETSFYKWRYEMREILHQIYEKEPLDYIIPYNPRDRQVAG